MSETINAIQFLSDDTTDIDTINSIILNDNLHKQFVYNALAAYIDYLRENNLLNTQRSCAKFINLLKSQHRILNNRYANGYDETIQNQIVNNSKSITKLDYPTQIKLIKTIREKRFVRGGRTTFLLRTLKQLRFNKKLQHKFRRFSKKTFNRTVITKNVTHLIKNFHKNYKKYKNNLPHSKKVNA